MPLEEMLQALEFEAVAECERITAQGQSLADKILTAARAEAERRREERLAKASLAAHLERAKVVKAARFAVKKAIIKAKEAAIEEVFTEAAKRLASIRQDEAYKGIFAKLATEALEGLTGPVRVRVDPRDRELAEEVLAGQGVECTLETNGNFAGGVEVYSTGGKIHVVNTLESRLEKARLHLKTEIADLLFA